MADSKVSDLTAATQAVAADQTYLVQSSASKSITVGNLFGYINTPAVFNDKVVIGDHDTITAAGVISTDTNVTFINDPSGAGACTIGAGTDGQIKIVIMSSNSGGHSITVGGSNLANTITLNSSGNSATMLYDSGLTKWYFIGGSATVS